MSATARRRQRHAVHSAHMHAIAPHQAIARGMPLDRIGEYSSALKRGFPQPIFARHPHPARSGAGPDAIAAADVATHDDRGEALVVTDGLFAVDELRLPNGMAVVDNQMIGSVRVIDTFNPEPS